MILNITKDILNITYNKTEEINYYDTIIKRIEDYFTSENFDSSQLDSGKDEQIVTEKMIITLTTTENQKNNENVNLTIIELGDCERNLRHFNNLSINETIYMKKIDVKQEGMKIPKIEYDVYSKLNGSKLIKLNLSVCENDKITISIPVSLSENIDILNSSSSYYNNICYKATSESGTDISLKDRKNEFVNNNKTLCQEDCDFIEYNYTTSKAICSCQVKESSSTFADMNINKTKLLDNIKDIKSFLNINLLLCFDNLFKIENIMYNIGFYIITFIIIFHMINALIFFIKKFRLIKKK